MSSAHFTLFSHRGAGPNPLKVSILLEKLGLTYTVVPLDFDDKPGTGVKGTMFLNYNPNGRVPAIVDHEHDDYCIWESGAILLYLTDRYDTEGLYYGKTPEERGTTAQWLTHQLSGFGPVQGNLHTARNYWEYMYGEKASKADITRFEGESHRLYKVLDDQLAIQAKRQSPWIALDRASIADFAFYPWVNLSDFGKLDISQYKNVIKWHAMLAADKDVKQANLRLSEP